MCTSISEDINQNNDSIKEENNRARGKEKPYGDVDIIIGMEGKDTTEVVELVKKEVGCKSIIVFNIIIYFINIILIRWVVRARC